MSKEVMLSVIIPAYNAEKYLDDCLKSVMTRQNASYEVVLVNDGSTDGTARICRRWADKYQNIRYIEQENQGQGSARNTAIDHAAGEWLVFLDADDMMLPGALDYLERSIADDYDILVYGQLHITNTPGIVWAEMPPDSKDKRKIMQKAVSVLWDKMFRRTFWKREGIRLQNTFGEDVYPIYMLEAKADGICTKQIPLICHYDREDNLTSQPEKYIQFAETLADVIKTFYEKGMLEEYKKPLLFSLMLHHKNYCQTYRENHRKEDKYIAESLERLAKQYFPEDYRRLFDAEQEILIIIGKIARPFPAELEAAWTRYYECLEQYLLDTEKPMDTVCHFIVNVENDVQSVETGIRTLDWALSYWKMQCMEMLEIKEERNLKGSIFLYCENRSDTIKQYEKAASRIWKCSHLDALEDFWEYADLQDNIKTKEIALTEEEKAQLWSSKYFNYRNECLRLDSNVRLLCMWLQLKQQGIKLETFFIENKYYRIGIYGLGYLGKLLADELKDSEVQVSFFIDRNTELKTDYFLYSSEAILPAADAVVVSVVHQYDSIKQCMKCAAKVISLQDVVSWCRNK